MKKAIILVMSCNQQTFLNEEEGVKQTYAKEILEGKHENLDILFYRGGADKSFYDAREKLYLSTENDDLNGTYHKTLDAFRFVYENFPEYDYIIRTNTSTYINIEAILQFLNLEEDYSGKAIGTDLIISPINMSVPFLRGHFLLFHKEIIKDLIDNTIQIECGIDDFVIGYMMGKMYSNKYLTKLLSVNSIHTMSLPYKDMLNVSYCVKIKNDADRDNIINDMHLIHNIYKSEGFTTTIKPPGGFNYIETIYGMIPI
jgi:hypothetical protein